MVRPTGQSSTLLAFSSPAIGWLSAWLFVAGATLLLPPRLQAQATVASSPCDPALIKPTKDPLAYGLRGEHCEGVYIRNVAGTGGLEVVAFVRGGQLPAIERGKSLPIEWPSGLDTPVFLRAVSLRRGLYYQMDARRPAGSTRWDWPTNVLNDLRLTAQELGVIAWTENRMGVNVQDVYVPIRLTAGAAATSDSSYVLQVVSESDVKGLYVRLATADPSGREQQVIIRDLLLTRAYYPSQRAFPIPIAVSALKEPGLYRLQLNAVLGTGSPSSKIVYFRHARP